MEKNNKEWATLSELVNSLPAPFPKSRTGLMSFFKKENVKKEVRIITMKGVSAYGDRTFVNKIDLDKYLNKELGVNL